MGGCRCSFRDCQVTTYKLPNMHFFRFPLKSQERYSKWRQYAQTEDMLKDSIVKQQNMAVCARHFRPEFFMNYKMERITKFAVPTLMRLSKTQALDFEVDVENGVLIQLEEPKLKHLIPPENFECILGLDADEHLLRKLDEVLQRCNITREEVEEDGDQEEDEELQTEETPVGIYNNRNTLRYELANFEGNEIIIEKPLKSSNTVEILETLQVSAPHLKRQRDDGDVTNEDAICAYKKTYLNSQPPFLRENVPNNSEPSTSQYAVTGNEYIVGNIENLPVVPQNQVMNEQSTIILSSEEFVGPGDDDDNEYFDIQTDDHIQDDFDANDCNSTIVELKSEENNNALIETMKAKLLMAQNEIHSLSEQLSNAKAFEAKVSVVEKENLSLKEKNKQYEADLEAMKEKLLTNNKENEKLLQTSSENNSLNAKLLLREKRINELEKLIEGMNEMDLKKKAAAKQLRLLLQKERDKHLDTKMSLQQQIATLEKSLELSQEQLSTMKGNLTAVKSNLNDLQLENLNLSKQNLENEQNLETLTNKCNTFDQDYKSLKSKYESLQENHSNLEHKYVKLEILHNQVATVTTSLEIKPKPSQPTVSAHAPQVSANTLTKAQLFNGIKRYISASMVSLLRMEMFGSTEREWKMDERQVAVDILRLGETVYKYFTDEWRFRLPALRDVRNWISQSVELDDEEDL